MKQWLESILVKNPEGEELKFECVIKRSPRVRRLNLRMVRSDRLTLTIPRWASLARAKSFLYGQENWLRRKSAEFPEEQSLSSHFTKGGKLCLNEIPLSVEWRSVPNASVRDNQLNMDKVLFAIDPLQPMESCLLESCIDLGKQFLPSRIERCIDQCGLIPEKVRIGNQRSRWGSCSSKGTISLNWRILLLPYALGEYVLFHELAHLREMNHSKRYWSCLEEMIPDARNLDRELSRMGQRLIRLGHEY